MASMTIKLLPIVPTFNKKWSKEKAFLFLKLGGFWTE
jgi:hypothetical protein